MMRKLYILFTFYFITTLSYAQSDSCAGMSKVCFSSPYNYTATGNGQGPAMGDPAEPGPYYNCLSATPNPSWFYFKANEFGNILINISSTTLDLDFVCWGPFYSEQELCEGLYSSAVDCSYSSASINNCLIPNAIPGDYYVLMVTNYTNEVGDVTITQVNNSNLDCPESNIISNSPICNSDTLKLSVNNPNPLLQYFWTGPCNFNSTQLNVVIPNISSPCAGRYKLTSFYNGYLATSDSVYITINNYPELSISSNSPDTVCFGSFIDLTPSGANSYIWNEFPTATSTLHKQIFENHNFLLTGYTLNCMDTVSRNVFVKGNPVYISPGDTTVCVNNHLPLHASGGYNYHWGPPGYISDTIGSDAVFLSFSSSNWVSVYYYDTISHCNIKNNIDITVDFTISDMNFISGPDSVCPGTSNLYQLIPNNISGNFIWYLLNGDSIITNVAKLSYQIGYNDSPGYLRVKSFNACPISDTVSKKIEIKSAPAKPSILVSDSSSICLGDTIFLSTDNNYDYYYWSNYKTTPVIYVVENGSFFLSVAGLNLCKSPNSDTVNIGVIPLNSTVIVLPGNYLHSLASTGNNWYKNNVFTGDTNTDYYFNEIGWYYSIIKNNKCKSNPSNKIYISSLPTNIEGNKINNIPFQIYPNPTADKISIEFNIILEKANISLFSIDGKLLKDLQVNNSQRMEIQLDDLKSGVYYLNIKSSNNTGNYKIIKM